MGSILSRFGVALNDLALRIPGRVGVVCDWLTCRWGEYPDDTYPPGMVWHLLRQPCRRDVGYLEFRGWTPEGLPMGDCTVCGVDYGQPLYELPLDHPTVPQSVVTLAHV